MVLNVNVKERPTGSFSIGAGYSSFDAAIGMAQVSQNNLFGYGQKLQLAAFVNYAPNLNIKDTTDIFVHSWL